jgi:hypothetical protein
MAVITSKGRKQLKRMNEEKMNNLNAKERGNFSHIAGLNLPENVLCEVYWGQDKLIIESSGVTYNLPFDRIKDICIKTDIDIQKAYVSSAGSAIAGAMVFGPLGAIVAGRAKEKVTKNISNYLIIIYKKEDTIDYISFNATNNPNANRFVYLFNQIPKVTEVVEL